MCNGEMLELGQRRSDIREIFEYGKIRKAQIGEENVFDFSLGNPSIPAPEIVTETILKLVSREDPLALHGYTSAPGDWQVRSAIAEDINRRFHADAAASMVYMTCGAAASLTISLHALISQGEEVILLAPYFPEYTVFAQKAGATVRVVNSTADFQIDFSALAQAINEKTKAIIINSPNNPTGAVLQEKTIIALADLLREKSAQFGTEIYIIADEPYRELVYAGVTVPYIPNYYGNTVVCYSFSKSLSLPGARIGYIFVSPKAACAGTLFDAICGAGRALGYVCAPSLLQYVVKECLGRTADIAIYEKNRNLLYEALTRYGYRAVKPDGAFYLFLQSPEPNAKAFCERAKKYELLLVPGDSFGVEGYVRISYCVKTEMLERALPAFQRLMEEYR